MLDDDFEEKIEAELARTANGPVWKTMDSAPREPGIEIIAATFGIYDGLTAMCERSPFVSFWMQTRRKFYGAPTHWLCKVPASFPSVRA